MEQLGISKLDLKRQNRMQVLKILKQRGPTSRIDISNTLELTRAAVTIITNEMIEQGVLLEIGEFKQTDERVQRGRKKILLDINHNYRFAVGVIIEEDSVSIGLSTLSGAVLDKRNMIVSQSTSFDEIISFIKTSLKEVLDYNCLNSESILGIGFGILPSMYSRMNIDVANKVADYSKFINTVEKFTKLPVVVDNSIKGAAMANIDFQKDKDPNRHNIAFLSYGDTFNFVVTNLNDPILSYDNRTDFVDKMIINPYSTGHNIKEVHKGNVKFELSASVFARKLKEYYSIERTPYLYKLTDGNIEKAQRSLIFEAINNGDSALNSLYYETIALTAVLVNNLVFSTNPQKLVMHDFHFDEKEFSYFKSIVAQVSGEDVAKSIDLSIIEEKNRFLAGSAIAIREFFFSRGGFDLDITE